uniref:Uncharacterized protein n=1 Tax=Meloidogyne incognita TaxID=6306 RepID=A0A914MVK3_MELIC
MQIKSLIILSISRLFLFRLFAAIFQPIYSSETFRQRLSQELYEVRVFEGAPIGTKATLNEAFDKALLPFNSCFAQMDSDLDWLDFDPLRLVFETISEMPQNNNSRPAQFAVLHLLCPTKKHSLHFSVHITRRNRHAPKFLESDYKFYAPIDLSVGAEIGRVQVQDQDPIIYNSQVQLSILLSSSSTPILGSQPRRSANNLINSDEEQSLHWDITKEGLIIVKRSLRQLRLYKPYQIRLLAIDFGSPQLFSLANVSVIPVSVSAPQNVRVNIANTHYQIFQWDLPTFGIPERFRLILKRKPSNKNEGENKLILHQQMIEPTETITMTRVRLLPGEQVEICIWAVDAEGETPSEIINFQTVENAPQCDGQCSSANVGLPMCYFSSAHYLRQFRDSNGNLNCLCFAGFSGPQCDKLAQRVLEQYGGVDWPETAVNNSAFVPCPYNEDGRRLERSCGWDSQTETPVWATASQQISKQTEQRETGGGSCRTQSSVLVHLGVLANYGQRNEQTLSGLQSVMRFLSTLLQFPAFQSNIHSAHFDAKIAEHVAQVLDVLATKNFSALGGMGNNNDNSSRLLRRQIADYTKEFARRLPNPFLLQSPSGGLQMRVWDILPSSSTSSQLSTDKDLFDDPNIFLEDKKEENSLKEDEDDDGGVQIGSCFVQPPKGRRNNYARIARAVCFKNATIALFPTLDEFEIISGNPVLMLEVRKSRNGQKKKRNEDGIISNPSTFPSELTEEISEENRDREPLLVGFRLPSISMSIEDEDNHTCAHYDYNAQIWSISGVVVLSRESRPNGQILLCEVHGLKSSGVFAALPDRLFARTDLGLAKAFLLFFENFGPTISAAFTIVLSLVLLFSFSIFKRSNRPKQQTDPAHLTLLLSFILLHFFHFLLLIRPQLSSNSSFLWWRWWPDSNILFLIFQLSLLSFTSSIALLTTSIYSRIVRLEVRTALKGKSRRARSLATLLFSLVLPLSLSVLTLILDGQILEGLDSDDPHLQPFNWIFGLFLLLPLIISLGIAMGFGAYSFWYANRLLAASFSSTTVPTTSASNWPTDSLESPSTNSISTTPLLLQRSLLHRLGKVSGLSWLLLLFPISNLLVLLQPTETLKSLVLFILHLLTFICLYLFHFLLVKIQSKMPQQNNQLNGGGQLISNSSNGNGIYKNNNGNGNINQQQQQQLYFHQNGVGNNGINQTERMMLTIQEHGQLQPIAPGETLLYDRNNINNFNTTDNLSVKER